MTALVRNVRTPLPTPLAAPGRMPVNALSGVRSQNHLANASDVSGHETSVLVSRRKRAKRRATHA